MQKLSNSDHQIKEKNNIIRNIQSDYENLKRTSSEHEQVELDTIIPTIYNSKGISDFIVSSQIIFIRIYSLTLKMNTSFRRLIFALQTDIKDTLIDHKIAKI